MPFVKISALPSDDFNCSDVMEVMEQDFADHAKLDLGSSTFLWQTLDCITHRLKGKPDPRSRRKFDPSESEIPIFVDLYITTVFDYEWISLIMKSITTILHEQTNIPRESVFIHTHVADPGHVYISDKVWPCVLTHPGTVAQQEEKKD